MGVKISKRYSSHMFFYSFLTKRFSKYSMYESSQKLFLGIWKKFKISIIFKNR